MVGLADAAPATKKVPIGGGNSHVEVYGISVRGIRYLLNRFPEIRKLLSGVSVTTEELIDCAPDAVSAIIACGLAKPEDPATEAEVDVLSIDLQMDLLQAIIELTMPQGPASFVKKLGLLGGVLNFRKDDQSPKDQAMSSS